MKISLKWLKEYVDVPDLPDDLQGFCDKLDLTGTGVEDVQKIGDNFDNIVTGQIISKEKHPDSDHMWITLVDVGDANVDENGQHEPLQIVCGAQNFEKNDKVCVALIGAVLPGDFKIKKSKLRGVYSCGMNCSEKELGLSDSHEGIMILDKDAPIGIPIAQYLGIGDTIIDTEITPNRPDCLSVVGCAREIAAIYDVDFKNPLADMADKINDVKIVKVGDSNTDGDVDDNVSAMPSVDIKDNEICPRYTARVIKGVKVGPSPRWLAERVTAMGARSINNIVDVTNYILFLFGQPLHAFDYDKLAKEGHANIIVRSAKDGEKFTTLDEEERVLNSDMTVISTEDKAVALAGVMGGLDSEVTDNTTSILLETATFSPAHTSRTSRRLGLISESSMRYERRVDDIDIDIISDASAALIIEVAGGSLCSSDGSKEGTIVDAWPVKTCKNKLKYRIDRFNKMMGSSISKDMIVNTLTRLGCSVSDTKNDVLSVEVPTFRPDLEREIDLYEEVLRIYGMDKIESTMPRSAQRVGRRTYRENTVAKVHEICTASGLNETVTYSFAQKIDFENIKFSNGYLNQNLDMDPVMLINPMSSEQSYLRQSIIGGLLRSVAYNINHGVSCVSLYEIGKVFYGQEDKQQPNELTNIAGVLCGQNEKSWNSQQIAYDFFDAKGVCENILFGLNLKKVKFKAINEDETTFLHPGCAAWVYASKKRIGWVGQIHPTVLGKYEIDQSVSAFELNLDIVIELSSQFSDYKDISQFPSVKIDIALVVDSDVSNEMMTQRISSAGSNLLKSVRLFDVYSDEKHLGKGKKSLAYSLEYSDVNATLTAEKVDKTHSKLLEKVCRSTGATIR